MKRVTFISLVEDIGVIADGLFWGFWIDQGAQVLRYS